MTLFDQLVILFVAIAVVDKSQNTGMKTKCTMWV